MNLLLDTHILIWALNGDSRLPEKAKKLILDPENVIKTELIYMITVDDPGYMEGIEQAYKMGKYDLNEKISAALPKEE